MDGSQHPFSNTAGRRLARTAFGHNLSGFAQGKRLQSSDEVGQKAGEVVIPLLQQQPGDRSLAPGDPFADQSCFPKAGGGRDEGQFVMQPYIQSLDQARTRDEFWSSGGIYSLVARIGVDIDQLYGTHPNFALDALYHR